MALQKYKIDEGLITDEITIDSIDSSSGNYTNVDISENLVVGENITIDETGANDSKIFLGEDAYDLTVGTPSAPKVGAYTVTNVGSMAYTFSGDAVGNNVSLTVYRGGTYTFTISASGHPFYITTDDGTNFSGGSYFGEYTTGVTGSRTQSGTMTWVVPSGAPDTLYYQCAFHSMMRGTIYVLDVPSNALSNTTVVAVKNVNDFAQLSLKNSYTGSSASADFIAYADNGDNNSGWIDMGITSSGFDMSSGYGITDKNDGYIFMSAPEGTPGPGNLVIATNDTGLENDIVFVTGGFDSTVNVDAEKMRIVGEGRPGRPAGVEILINTASDDPDTGALRVDGGIGLKGSLNLLGEIQANGGAIYQGARLSDGLTAKQLLDNGSVFYGYAGLTNACGIFTGDADDFMQFAVKNHSDGYSASTDIIAYASDGDNDTGWIDMGITSESFTDPDFTVTGPGTGYLFFSAPNTTSGSGDLLIGTDETGTQADIVFFTNGFDSGNERMRIIGQDRLGKAAGIEIYVATESTSTTTGALRVNGGIGLQGNMNISGDFSANDISANDISANDISASGLTTVQGIAEVINNKTGATGVVTHDFSTGSIFYHTTLAADFTVNITNVPTTEDRIIGIALVLNQGGTAYIPTALQIDGSAVTINWSQASIPSGNANQVDVVTFSLIRSGSAWTALGVLNTFG